MDIFNGPSPELSEVSKISWPGVDDACVTLCLLPGNVPSRFIHLHFSYSKSRSSVKGRVSQTVNQTFYVRFKDFVFFPGVTFAIDWALSPR